LVTIRTAGPLAVVSNTPSINGCRSKTEYLFLDLGTDSLVNGTVADVPFSVSEKTRVHTVKAGINVKFGGW
jgi:hypothetical protein